jgi:hypothetical protein
MILGVLTWADGQRAEWRSRLKSLRSGLTGTFEVRHHRRVDTTVETIADLSRRLGELEPLIAQCEADESFRDFCMMRRAEELLRGNERPGIEGEDEPAPSGAPARAPMLRDPRWG